MEVKVYPPIEPPALFKGISGIDPKLVKMRAYTLPDIVSVKINDLFPEIPEAIYPKGGIASIRKATEEALEKVDMSMIKPEHSVNILGAHHGFTILGGEAYAEMLRTIKDVIEKKTGCQNVRLRIGVGLRFREAEEYIRYHKLDEYFGRGKALSVAPVDEGVPIETEVGTFYGIRKVYDADWVIHAHNTDIRELYCHREIDRAMKPFAMAYARIETRSAYHTNFMLRSSNWVGRAIYESPFVQKKWAFTCFLMLTPNGITGVDAANDMLAFSHKVDVHNLVNYGKLYRLLGEIPECIAVFDQATPSSYSFAGGIIFCNFFNAHVDLFDLDVTAGTAGVIGLTKITAKYGVGTMNPAIKAWVINFMWGGLPSMDLSEAYPTIVVGRAQADMFIADPMNIFFMKHSVIADELETAMEFAYKIAKTRNVLVFDGVFGGLNVTKELAKYMFQKAPEVSKRVEQVLLPKWLRQRELNISMAPAPKVVAR